MGLFKRRRPEPPAWAEFFDGEEWEAFCAAIRSDVEPRGWSHDLEAGLVSRAPGEAGMWLGNLAQLCHAAPRAEWPGIVRTHFERLLAAAEPTPFSGPDEARAAIKARLVVDSFLADLPWTPAARRVADDLWLVLAYDLPDTVQIPVREKVLEWGAEDELFELAIEHARTGPGLELQRHGMPAGEEGGEAPVWALIGESFFTATHALWADSFDAPASEHGTLVAVPNRHTVLAHPIRDFGAVMAITHLLTLGHRMWVEGPGSISDGVYWRRDRTLERLDARVDEERVVFTPSDELVDVLNRLA
jgi:hypothetical protein